MQEMYKCCCGPVMADTGSGQLTDSKQRSHILEGLMRRQGGVKNARWRRCDGLTTLNFSQPFKSTNVTSIHEENQSHFKSIIEIQSLGLNASNHARLLLVSVQISDQEHKRKIVFRSHKMTQDQM